MDLYDIHVPATGEFCTVTTGPHRQTYLTTKAELLAALAADPGAERRGTGGTWLDLLASHGFAMKSSGQLTTFLMVAPAISRRITFTRGTGTPLRFDLTFPPCLFTFRFQGNRYQDSYQTGKAYIIDPAAVPSLTVAYPSPCLAHFPFGNVFNHGGICWGGTNLTAFTPTTPQAVIDAFFDSPFNGHLWSENHHEWADLPSMATALRTATPPNVVPWTRGYPVTPLSVTSRL